MVRYVLGTIMELVPDNSEWKWAWTGGHVAIPDSFVDEEGGEKC